MTNEITEIKTTENTYLWALAHSMTLTSTTSALEIQECSLDEVCSTIGDNEVWDGDIHDYERFLDSWNQDCSFAILRCSVTF